MRGKLSCLFFTIALILVTGACTKKIIKSPTAEELVIFPPPPDTTRVQFLTYINTSADVVKPPSGFKKFFLGEEKPKSIGRPYGITVTDDRIYVCDPGIGGLEIMDLKKQNFEYFIPTGIGQLQMPLNCFVDEMHYLFVADANRRQIVVYDLTGKYVRAFGEAENFKPIDVFVTQEKIYVTNLAGHAYHVYDRISFELLQTFPDASEGDDGFLYKPTSIYRANNETYVTDFGEAKIKIYDDNGNFLRSVGSYGRGIGQFARPKGICTDQDTNLYVVDAAYENVQIFNNEGRLLMYFGKSGNMGLPAGVSVSYDNLDFFRPYVYKSFDLKFLILVTNQYGPNKIGVYGFVEQWK